MEHTFQKGIQVSKRRGHLSPILAGGFCEPLEIRLVEVAQVYQAVEFLIRLCGPEALSQLEALIQAHLHVIGHFNIGMLQSEGDFHEVVESVALGEESTILLFKAETLIGLEEGNLDSCQEAWVSIRKGIMICSIQTSYEALQKEA